MKITRGFFAAILFGLVLACCWSATAASNDGKVGEKNNQLATFNISSLSAQVIASTQEMAKVEVEKAITEENITDTPAYRLFTLQRETAKYVESVGGGGYQGSLLDFLSIDADTTCYFCIPRSQWPSDGWKINEE
jgi:outer membrane murein-binding lipoprotein Lpp